MNTLSNGGREELAHLLAGRTLELVRVPSPSGDEGALADTVQRFLHRCGNTVFLRRHGRAVVAGYGHEEPQVVLVGHLDTVPPAGHPAPVILDDEIIGLGTTDMKGALAVMMTVAEAMGDQVGSLGLVFYDGEETAFEQNGLRPLFGLEPWLKTAELALMLEPTNNVVELGCLGTLHGRVVFHGTAAHSARPWTGRNAIHEAIPFLEKVSRIPEREVVQGPALYREVMGVTLAAGGTTRNVVPDRFEVNVNLRFAPDRSPQEAEEYFRSLLPPDVSVEIADLAPAASARFDAPRLRGFVDEQGLEVRAKQAWTDVVQFAEQGVAAANFGPGVPELAHKRDERVPVKNLVRCYEVLHRFLSGEGKTKTGG